MRRPSPNTGSPGNVGRGARRDEKFASMIELACRYDKAVRIGVNWGSMDQELVVRMMDENSRSGQPKDNDEVIRQIMVVSALDNARRAEELGLGGTGSCSPANPAGCRI